MTDWMSKCSPDANSLAIYRYSDSTWSQYDIQMEYATPRVIYIPGGAIKITLCQLTLLWLQGIIGVEQLIRLLGYLVPGVMSRPHISLH